MLGVCPDICELIIITEAQMNSLFQEEISVSDNEKEYFKIPTDGSRIESVLRKGAK